MEADDCTLSINTVEFLSQTLRTLPEVYSEDSNRVNGSQFTDGPSHASISDKHSCNNQNNHTVALSDKPLIFIQCLKTSLQE